MKVFFFLLFLITIDRVYSTSLQPVYVDAHNYADTTVPQKQRMNRIIQVFNEKMEAVSSCSILPAAHKDSLIKKLSAERKAQLHDVLTKP